MEKRSKRTKEKNSMRRESVVTVGIYAYIGSLIFRIILCRMIGIKGTGYFGIAAESFVIFSFCISYGLSEAVAALVRYRIKREQYKNAEKVLRCAVILAIVVGGIFSLAFLFFGQLFAEKVVGLPLSGLAVQMMAPALVFGSLSGVYRGYFQGNGTRVPTVHSKILEMVLFYAGGLLGCGLLHGYGEKVSALLQNEDYAAAYGAMGATVGFLVSSVFCLLHLMFLAFVYRRNSKRLLQNDTLRYQEKNGHILHMLISAALPAVLYALVFHCLPLLDGCLYLHMAKEGVQADLAWGNYYGKYLTITGIVGSLIALTGIEPVRRIMTFIEREEYRLAKERTGIMIHQLLLISVPAAIFTAVLAENILHLLFCGNNTKEASYLMWGCFGIPFYVLAIVFLNMLVRLKKMKPVVACGGIAVLTHAILVYVLLHNTGLDILAPVIGGIVFYLILAGFGFLLLCRSLQYTQEWIRSVAFTVITAGIAGLIIMLINRVLTPAAGTTVSLFVCLPVGMLVYIILLTVTRAVSEKEMESMKGGGVLMAVARLLHFM